MINELLSFVFDVVSLFINSDFYSIIIMLFGFVSLICVIKLIKEFVYFYV